METFINLNFQRTTLSPRSQNTETGLKRVLIAEDNEDLRTIFARTFDRRHFAVDVAEDGAVAMQKLKAELPDVLILDANMPNMSGFEVLRRVRDSEQMRAIKIVLVTGNCMAIHSPEAELADLVLIKPVSIGDLITLAQRLVPARAGASQ
jgi:CheY-like chemotaxis protein